MKKALPVMLALLMLMLTVTPAFAAAPGGTVASPQYKCIVTTSVLLDINKETGIAHCYTSCYCRDDYTVDIEYRLERNTSAGWEPVKTWVTTGTRFASLSKDWAVYSGYLYRGFVTFRIRDASGNLLETATSYNEDNYPKK